MKCAACQLRKGVKEYGGSLVCNGCYNFYNPKITIVDRLSDIEIKRIKTEISVHEYKIHKLQMELNRQERLFSDNNLQSISTVSSYHPNAKFK